VSLARLYCGDRGRGLPGNECDASVRRDVGSLRALPPQYARSRRALHRDAGVRARHERAGVRAVQCGYRLHRVCDRTPLQYDYSSVLALYGREPGPQRSVQNEDRRHSVRDRRIVCALRYDHELAVWKRPLLSNRQC